MRILFKGSNLPRLQTLPKSQSASRVARSKNYAAQESFFGQWLRDILTSLLVLLPAVFCPSLWAQSPTVYELPYAPPGDHIASVKITAFCFSVCGPLMRFRCLARQRGNLLGPLRSGCASHLVARRFDRFGSDPRCRSHIRRPPSPF